MTSALLLVFAFAPLILISGFILQRWLPNGQQITQPLVMLTSILGAASGMLLWFFTNSENQHASFSLISFSQADESSPYFVIAWGTTNPLILLLVGFYLVLGLLAFPIDTEKTNRISSGIFLGILAIPQLMLGVGLLHVAMAWGLLFLCLLRNSITLQKPNFDFLVFFTEVFFFINLLALATICKNDAAPRLSSFELHTQSIEYIQNISQGLPGYFEGLSLAMVFVVCSRLGMLPFLNLRRSLLDDAKSESVGQKQERFFDWLLRIFGSLGLLFQFEFLLAVNQIGSRPPIISQTALALGLLSAGVWGMMAIIQLLKRRAVFPSLIFAIAALSMTLFFANIDGMKNWSSFFLIAAGLLIPFERFLASKRAGRTSQNDEVQFAEVVYEIPAKKIPNGFAWFSKQVDQFVLDPTLNESQKHICFGLHSQLRWIALAPGQLGVVLMFLALTIFLFVLVLT